MTIELNIPEKTISIYHNNKFVDVAFENVDTNNINYYLCVAMSGVNDEMIFEKMEIMAPPSIVLAKFDEFESALINCNKAKVVIGSGQIVGLSLKLLYIAQQIADDEDMNHREYNKTEKNTKKDEINLIRNKLMEWIFPPAQSLEQVAKQIQPIPISKRKMNKDMSSCSNEMTDWIQSTKDTEAKCKSSDFVDNYQNNLQQLKIQKDRVKKTSGKIKTILQNQNTIAKSKNWKKH